jgi:integrase
MTGQRFNRLNSARFNSLMKPGTKPGRYSDGGNLYLSVGTGNARRWVFLFRWRKRLREMGLGSAGSVSLQRAREKASNARALLADGTNPLDVKRVKAKTPLFGKFAQEVVDELESGWRNEKHAEQWRSTLKNDAASLSPIPVDQITTEDILRALKPIWGQKPETAQRLRARIQRVLEAAKAKGFRAGENPAHWKGHLDQLLPKPKKLERGHHPAMPFEDVPEFAIALKAREGVAARALEFLITTAARSGEVRGARWGEIDLDKKLWTIPAERMKAGREHRVPLPQHAIDILNALLPLSGGDAERFVFPSPKMGQLSDMSLSAVLRRMKVESGTATVHGFRSSFRDWAGEMSSFPREIAEAALAHVVGDTTERAYRRGDALEKRRKLMDAWSDFTQSKSKGNNIVQMRVCK